MNVTIPKTSSEVDLPEPNTAAAVALKERLRLATSAEFVSTETQLVNAITKIKQEIAEFRNSREISAAKKAQLASSAQKAERDFIEAELAKIDSWPLPASSELHARALNFLVGQMFGSVARRKFHNDRAALDAKLASLFQDLDSTEKRLQQHRARVLGEK